MNCNLYAFMDLLNPQAIIKYGGTVLLLLIIFAETGLFFGFFLPGDSLLFMAGLLSNSEYLKQPIWLLIPLLILSAVTGATFGYWFGLHAKQILATKRENFFYKKKYLDITQDFYDRYGMMALIMGRFIPMVRTFTPILAGVVRINFKKFLFYNIVGAILWIITMVMSGYWLGNLFPGIIQYLEIIVVGMIVITSLPVIVSWLKFRKFTKAKNDEKYL